jgi:hypothetical protein
MSCKLLWASNLLTAAVCLSDFSAAQADTRCSADLGRVNNDFCIGDQHRDGAAKLDYAWSVNDEVFDFASKLCLTTGAGAGGRSDMVLALDRSASLRLPDKQRKKLGSDSISVATQLIERLRDEAKEKPEEAPKVALLLFAGDDDCREYAGGPIGVSGDFPCLFVPARSIADAAHVDKLLAMVAAADGQYAIGERARAGRYGIVTQLMRDDRLGLGAAPQSGLVLFSDGRSYQSDAPYPYLRSAAFADAQAEVKRDFGDDAMKKTKLVFALSPAPVPLYDAVAYGASYENMCDPGATPPGAEADCNAGVSMSDANTWPTNKVDGAAFATQLVGILGGVEVVTVTARDDLDKAVDKLRRQAFLPTPIESASYRVNESDWKAAELSGTLLELSALPSSEVLRIDILLKSASGEISIPLQLATTKVPAEPGKELQDREMLCAAEAPVAPATQEPKPDLSNLQGGSASCGTLGDDLGETDRLSTRGAVFAFMLAPVALALLLMRRRRGAAAQALALAAAGFAASATNARAAEQAKGLNALQYRPVVDGVAQTEKADVLAPGAVNAGIFMDYANDTVELGGEKNKRLDSVMDDLVTAHAVLNVGLFKRTALGAHVPYVHKTDVDRSVEGDEVEGGEIGMPADSTVFIKVNAVQRGQWSLALMPLATLPTGRAELLLGDGVAKYGALGILSGARGAFRWAFNAGYLQRDKPQSLTDDRAHPIIVRGQGLVGLGGEYVINSLVAVGGNFQIKPSAGEGLDAGRASPAEWMLVGKLKPIHSLETNGGFGTGLGKGYGAPDYRVWAGVAWTPHPSAARPSLSTAAATAKKRK